MTAPCTSERITMEAADRDLLDAFERLSIPVDAWTHRLMLRVSYLYVVDHGFVGAAVRMRHGLQAISLAHGVPENATHGYHETSTKAWLRLISALTHEHGTGGSSEAFLDAHPQLLDAALLDSYYSPDRLASPGSKGTFVDGDIAQLPRLVLGGDHERRTVDLRALGGFQRANWWILMAHAISLSGLIGAEWAGSADMTFLFGLLFGIATLVNVIAHLRGMRLAGQLPVSLSVGLLLAPFSIFFPPALFLWFLLGYCLIGSILRHAGIRLDWLGRPTDIAYVLDDDRCTICGYDVTNLASAMCPECGTDLTETND